MISETPWPPLLAPRFFLNDRPCMKIIRNAVLPKRVEYIAKKEGHLKGCLFYDANWVRSKSEAEDYVLYFSFASHPRGDEFDYSSATLPA